MPKNKKIVIGEFEFISRYLKPLSEGFKGAMQLGDDVAIIPKDKKTDYVVTLDTIVEDIHFIWKATPEQIANKLLRSNLSDIASCGAIPKFYLMTGNLSKEMDKPWIRRFTGEIGRIQKKYEFSLLGGDTVRSPGEKFFSVTMIGEVPKREALLRSGAKVGDDIYLSGKIGEAWVGLQILKGRIKIPKAKRQRYIDKHYSPEPRITLGRKLLKIATSCTDISDGLLKDLTNILDASEVSAIISFDKIPLALKDKKYFNKQISAGDDYQLIFTAKPLHEEKIKRLNCHKIGKIVANNKREKIIILDKNKKKIKFKRLGYEH